MRVLLGKLRRAYSKVRAFIKQVLDIRDITSNVNTRNSDFLIQISYNLIPVFWNNKEIL
jgi:hypothetical protein